MTNPPVPDPAEPGTGWSMLPKDIRPGDRLWLYDPAQGGSRWAAVRTITYDRRRAAYRARYEHIRATGYLSPRARLRVRRDWDAWPEWDGTPPCSGCGEPARLVGGTAMLRHTERCPVNARQRAQISNGHRPGEEQ